MPRTFSDMLTPESETSNLSAAFLNESTRLIQRFTKNFKFDVAFEDGSSMYSVRYEDDGYILTVNNGSPFSGSFEDYLIYMWDHVHSRTVSTINLELTRAVKPFEEDLHTHLRQMIEELAQIDGKHVVCWWKDETPS